MMNNIEYILFDAANTLIHKPLLWTKLSSILKQNNIIIDNLELKRNHKFLSEIIHFPDRTNKDFYTDFNTKLLLSLGVIPNITILNSIYEECSYLPWEVFEDTKILSKLKIPFGILSNFKSNLPTLVEEKFDISFKDIIVSETEGISKPSKEFYTIALQKIGLNAKNILYIGDSIRLDIIPAQELGINTLLIDRDDFYKPVNNKIINLTELLKFV